MSRAEKFIEEHTKDSFNYNSYAQDPIPWLTPDQARKAVEIAREEILTAFSCGHDNSDIYGHGITYGQVRAWLERQGKKPAVWSEEDEDIINHLLAICSGAKRYRQFAGCSQDDVKKCQTWLKSLRPQNTWKPSDEQMEALKSAAANCAYSEYQDCLRELIEQLEKLKD